MNERKRSRGEWSHKGVNCARCVIQALMLIHLSRLNPPRPLFPIFFVSEWGGECEWLLH
jgi:hypothetical protein